MKNITYTNMKHNTRSKVNSIFIDAALVFECSGDWRLIFKRAYNTTNGHSKKMFSGMMKSTDATMEKFCSDLIKNTKRV